MRRAKITMEEERRCGSRHLVPAPPVRTSRRQRLTACGRVLQAMLLAAGITFIPPVAAAPEATASVGVGVGATWVRPGWRPYLPGLWAPYLAYGWPGPCWAYGPCTWGGWYDDYAWRRPVAPDPPQPTRNELWDYGSTWGYLQRLPPATPETHIQPAYRDTSTVRPEYAESGRRAAP